MDVGGAGGDANRGVI